MARKKKSTTKAEAKPTRPIVPGRSNQKMSRREMMGGIKILGLTTLVVGGGGFYFASKISTAMAEEDMTRIGNGVPTIVQVHDPGCSQCMALQRHARTALQEFADTNLQYVVANIHTPEGRAFAEQHGVGHVTLVLMDEAGRVREVLQGVRTSAALVERFRRLTGTS